MIGGMIFFLHLLQNLAFSAHCTAAITRMSRPPETPDQFVNAPGSCQSERNIGKYFLSHGCRLKD